MYYGKGKGSFSVSDGWDMWALLKVEAWTGLEVGKKPWDHLGKKISWAEGKARQGFSTLKA